LSRPGNIGIVDVIIRSTDADVILSGGKCCFEVRKTVTAGVVIDGDLISLIVE
jgi:hypothetical protein